MRLCLALLGVLAGLHAAQADDNAPAVALVATMQPARKTLPATLQAYGQVVAGPGGETTVSLAAGGIVAALPVSPGQAVAAGATLAVIRPDAQSVAELTRARDAVVAAAANRAHVAALLASRLATRADLAAADQASADAAAALAALQAAGAGTARTLRAPSAGVVSALLASAGTAQPAGAGLLRLIETDKLVATVGVPPAQAGAIAAGDPALVTELGTGTVLPGHVTLVAEMVDPQTGLIDVTLALAGAPLAGAAAAAVITTGALTGDVVPRDAVQTDAQGDYVFQIDAQSIAHRVPVRVLGNAGDQTVLAPLPDPAMPLVTRGAYQLDDGAAVRVGAPGP
jgi:RND family efflux transporter MFP subunit